MKVILSVAVGIVVLSALLVFYARALKRPRSYNTQAQGSVSATQELVRIIDFDGPLALRDDGARIAFVGVKGKKLDFLPPRAKDEEVASLSAAFASLDYPFCIHRVMCPVDSAKTLFFIEAEIARIDDAESESFLKAQDVKKAQGKQAAFVYERKCKALSARKHLLTEVYRPRVSCAVPAFSVETFLTLEFLPTSTVQADAQKTVASFSSSLAEAGYATYLMSPTQIERVLTNYYGRTPCSAYSSDF